MTNEINNKSRSFTELTLGEMKTIAKNVSGKNSTIHNIENGYGKEAIDIFGLKSKMDSMAICLVLCARGQQAAIKRLVSELGSDFVIFNASAGMLFSKLSNAGNVSEDAASLLSGLAMRYNEINKL